MLPSRPNDITTPKILYVSSEISPFLDTSEVAKYIYKLLTSMKNKKVEIRILVPRFGVIKERQNRLHEVVRLSGVNIPIGREDKPLTIKVSNIPQAKLQVYFIDNDDYFSRKGIYRDNTDAFYSDNDERLIFFCRGVLETVKKLGWEPNIIHCNDWFSSLIPLYLKTNYKDDPIFKDSKVIFTIYNTYFDDKINNNIFKTQSQSIINKDLKKISKLDIFDYFTLINIGAKYSDKVFYSNKVVENIVTENTDLADIQTIAPNENYEESYWEIYQSLLKQS